MARRAVSEQVIRSFFSSPAQARTLFPESVSRAVKPLSESEMSKLGKLAGLQVSNRPVEFRTSVAQVLDFCAAIERTRSMAPPKYVPFEHDVPFEPPSADNVEDEAATEGGYAEVLLRNARWVQEGYFVAPASRPATSTG